MCDDPSQIAYKVHVTHPVLCTHLGFNKGILAVARHYPTPGLGWGGGGIVSLNFNNVLKQASFPKGSR